MLCHQPQNADPSTGNSLDLKVMAHKIHMGSQLPSVVGTATTPGVPYQIVGFMNSVNDFSTVVDPADPRRCEVCHSQTTGAAQAKAFLTEPSRAPAAPATTMSISPPAPTIPADSRRTTTSAPTAISRKVRRPSMPPSWARTWCPPIRRPLTRRTRIRCYRGINLAITSVTNTSAGQNAHRRLHGQGRQRQQYRAVEARRPPIHHGRSDHRLRLHQFRQRHHSTPGYVTESAPRRQLRLERHLHLHLHACDSDRRPPERTPSAARRACSGDGAGRAPPRAERSKAAPRIRWSTSQWTARRCSRAAPWWR